MGYEIDYLAAGDGERSAHAVCLRYGNLFGQRNEQTVVTIDGGTLESGDALVKHVKTYYGTDTVDIAILSHADTDHASGMRNILEGLKVKQLAMHLPWNHSSDVKEFLDDGRVTTDSIRENAKRNLSTVREIEQLAKEKGIPVIEPFAGASGLGLRVIGPTKDFYQEMLAGFRFMPGTEIQTTSARLGEALRALGATVANWVSENWFTEKLQEPAPDATSSENNSSVIFTLDVDDKKFLFTGDAGVPALQAAIAFVDANGISLAGLYFFDVPHHGSRRNLGPSVLNRLFGGVRGLDAKDWYAYISAAKDGAPKHPHKKVTNALRRRGASVHATAGINIWLRDQAPARSTYGSIEPIQFYTQVENDD